MIGRTIAHYQVIEKLGEGGMGVVYKATDTRLARFVALKLLPPDKVHDTVRKQRFVQEAKAASALNHPNIVTVHDIGSTDGVDFIAMEYVAGKTLDALIPRKGMRLGEALKIAIQVADALAAAHASGIVHRDLKPGNVIVGDDGRVRVLDFGLAKLTEATASSDETRTALDDARPRTDEGSIIGTVSYMSPEQAEGRPVDTRSDIFSFGSVLYEMVTGQRAFQGAAPVSTLAAIIKEEPKSIGEVAHDIPAELDRIIRRCLRKDPGRRFQHIAEVKVALEDLKEESDSGKLAAPPPSARKRRTPWLSVLMAAAVVVLVAAAAVFWWQRQATPPQNLQPVPVTTYAGDESVPSFSPDGSKMAFAWDTVTKGEFALYPSGNTDIYVKQIGSPAAPLRLTDTPEREDYPAWSPDDRWIAFTRRHEDGMAVLLVPSLGGPERKLTQLSDIEGLCWTPDSRWIVLGGHEASQDPLSLWVLSVETGERRRLTETQGRGGLRFAGGDRLPSVSPDGRTVAFGRQIANTVFGVYALRLTPEMQPDGEPASVTDQRYANFGGVAWTAGGDDIVYAAGGQYSTALWRVPILGSRAPVRLPYALADARYPAIAGTTGRLAYSWFLYSLNIWRLDTQTGAREKLIGSTYYNARPRYSPDGRKIAFDSNRSGNAEIWTCQADGANCQQLTSFAGPLTGSPRWSPDGNRLAFDSRAEGHPEIYVIAADGGTPRRLAPGTNGTTPGWSRDGQWVYFGGDGFGLRRASVSGGLAEDVVAGAYSPHDSADGHLYYQKGDGGLFRRPAGGGREQPLLPRVAQFDIDVTKKGVYFTLDGKSIQFLDPATGKATTLAIVEDLRLGSGLAASPDDRYVLWAQVDQITRDLMMVEGFQ